MKTCSCGGYDTTSEEDSKDEYEESFCLCHTKRETELLRWYHEKHSTTSPIGGANVTETTEETWMV